VNSIGASPGRFELRTYTVLLVIIVSTH